MKLFPQPADRQKNILPADGMVFYYGVIMPKNEADYFFDHLLKNIAWQHDEAMMFGKKIITKRKVAWYGDRSFEYTYSGVSKYAMAWTNDLLTLKNLVEKLTDETYNSCLLNLYHDGAEGMAWHSDGEPDLLKDGAIASLSFGAERKFSFKHKTNDQKVSLILEHGSLLLMRGQTQTFWQHRLPPTKLIREPRINLTFRTVTK